jgi:hypothetical protein
MFFLEKPTFIDALQFLSPSPFSFSFFDVVIYESIPPTLGQTPLLLGPLPRQMQKPHGAGELPWQRIPRQNFN